MSELYVVWNGSKMPVVLKPRESRDAAEAEASLMAAANPGEKYFVLHAESAAQFKPTPTQALY